MQLFGKCASRIAFPVNPATLSQDSESVPHRTLCPVQYFSDGLGVLVPGEVEQDPIVIF
jgi:hypothetical protein